MSNLDVIGHAFYASIGFGMVLLARKSWLGWIFRFVGEAGWVWLGWTLGMSSIWAWGTVFLVMDTYGLASWIRGSPEARICHGATAAPQEPVSRAAPLHS